MRVLTALAVLLGVTLAVLLVRAIILGSPEIFIERELINFGGVPEGEVRTSCIRISNRGSGTLDIREVRGNCTCTMVAMQNSSLRSGESTQLEITIRGAKRPESEAAVVIRSNDRLHPARIVRVLFQNDAPFYMQPSRLDFGDIPRQKLPISIGATLKCRQPFTEKVATEVDADCAAREWADLLVEETQDPCILKLTVTLRAGAPSGEIIGRATIKGLGVVGNVEFYAHVVSDAVYRVVPLSIDVSGSIAENRYSIPLRFRDKAMSWNVQKVEISKSLQSMLSAKYAADESAIIVETQLETPSASRIIKEGPIDAWGHVQAELRSNLDEREEFVVPVHLTASGAEFVPITE